MILRKILGKEWKSPNDAFYSKPKKGLFRGSYWCWYLQGSGNNPKIWIMINHIAVGHTLNKVQSKVTKTNKKEFGTMMSCWYYDKGKFHDLFVERSITSVEKKKLISKTDSGYILELTGDIENYKLLLKKGKNIIVECKNKPADFSKIAPIKYENSYNTKSFNDKKNNAYLLISEDIRVPQLIKISNMFSYADVKFNKKRFTVLSYIETNGVIGSVMPWKYAIFDLKDDSKFRCFWSFRSFIKTPRDIDVTFEDAKTGKKYFFNDVKNLEFYYINDKNKKTRLFDSSSKFVVVKSSNEDGVKIEVISEIVANHVYYYRTNSFGISVLYNQMILRLKKIEITENRKKIRFPCSGIYGYGEYVNF